LLNFAEVYRTFTNVLAEFDLVLEKISKKPDLQGNSYIGLIPFLIFSHRSIAQGFYSLMSYQSFFAWPYFRTGLETMLIVGKLVNNQELAETWKNHASDNKKYIEEFQGKLDKNNSLPKRGELKALLSTINTLYLHPNPKNIELNTTVVEDGSGRTYSISIQWFDTDADVHEAHVYAYMRITSELIDSVKDMIEPLYGNTPSTQESLADKYQKEAHDRVVALTQKRPETKTILEELGGWTLG